MVESRRSILSTPWRLPPGDERFLTMRYMQHHRLFSLFPKEPSRVLDVGCGDGAIAAKLANLGHEVTGVEIREDRLEDARRRCHTLIAEDFHDVDWNEYAGTFDVLFLGSILEHIVWPEDALRLLLVAVRQHGLVIISVPNVANWRIRGRLLLGRFVYDSGICGADHVRFFTFQTAREMAESTGLRVERIVPVPDVPLLRHKRGLEEMNYAVAKAFPGWFAVNIVMRCVKEG